ncbi:hypothetical protein KC354_g16338 [Hortaea werneckii]|nr:hypothetical protein KC354_g16338 [Hortaea werneckii]
MSNTTAKNSRTTGSAITPNNVQQRNKPAEYFFHSMWMRAQDLDAKLQKYKEMPMAKALEMSTYRASIYKAQAKAYREAANAPSEEMRSGWVKRAMVLGFLAEAIEKFPALSPHLLSDDVANSLFRVEPIVKIEQHIKKYVATAKRLQAAQAEGTAAGPSVEADDTTTFSDEGSGTPHRLFDEGAHMDEDLRMQDLDDRSIEEPDTSDPKVAAAVDKFNELMALLKH